MGHTKINNGKYHEDECLQGDHQDVEDRPSHLQYAAEDTEGETAAVHQCNQDKYHFAGKHVAIQAQRQ